MKRALLLIVFVILTLNSMQAQMQLIAVQHPTLDSAKFYGNIQMAIDSAWVGSSIYLPAIIGDYTDPGFTVNKKVYIYGAGHDPDSSAATGRTVINGNITVNQGADSGGISGLYITGDIYVNTVNTFHIQRNRLNNLYFNSNVKNLLFTNNVVAGFLSGGNAQNCIFQYNFFGNTHAQQEHPVRVNIYNLSSCNFLNNIFFAGIGYVPWESWKIYAFL